MNKFHKLNVKDIRKETAEAVSISFEIPENLKDEFNYLPGQYVTLKVHTNGVSLNRSYSLCSNPFEEDEHRIAVKKVPGGKVSTYLTNSLKIGDEIEVMSPMGNFHPNVNANDSKNYFLFGAGSGITPLISILKAVLSVEPESKVMLLYGNYNGDTVIFKEQLDKLQNKYQDRMELVHIFDKPNKKNGFLGFGRKMLEDLEFIEGQINEKIIKENLKGKNIRNAEFYTCGPTGMMKAVENTLIGLNVDNEKINVEYFTEKNEEDKVSLEVGEREADYDGVTKISVQCDGSEYIFTIKQNDTLLDACSKNNVDPPFACMVGACTTCRCKLNEGSVTMGDCDALTPKEIEQGYILSCQAKPTSSKISIDFDA